MIEKLFTRIRIYILKQFLFKKSPPVLKKYKKYKPRHQQVALLAAYNGNDYHGVDIQNNRMDSSVQIPTIEGVLFPALVKIGAWHDYSVKERGHFYMNKYSKASRTDKGVSACEQVFSMKVKPVPNFIERLNKELPEQIVIFDFKETTPRFDARKMCVARSYMYIIPTYVFADIEELLTYDYRIDPNKISKVREVLHQYVGNHKFHNFTTRCNYEEDRARRKIIFWKVSDPFVDKGIEFMILRVKGQSFMMHQIRRMIALTVAIVRGYCGSELIKRSFESECIDIPRVPGNGLVLEELHYDSYNKRYINGGKYDRIEWQHVREAQTKFMKENIIASITAHELTYRTMFNWSRRTLQMMDWGTDKNKKLPEWWITFMVFRSDYVCEKRFIAFNEFESRPWYIKMQ